ncbi:esterase [Niabella ginsenosidivorans]|uniref:Esterase n=1 Tax=Niabella ginsenosidivorans TaxID=1176587 RepID=A0A1A9I7J9_9BACT|nr:alpha/beta hydrolase-fold protein [Niabella ginsenosidivorans]ANH83658.1 esterase [Niabella ginsenosidivorans]
MNAVKELNYKTEGAVLSSAWLKRDVIIDFYFPACVDDWSALCLLLINDGQDLHTMDFVGLLAGLYAQKEIRQVLCVGITAGPDRKREYGTAAAPDYMGRGDLAGSYTKFVLEELLPYTAIRYHTKAFKELAFAGFSLGGLSALDIVWNHPDVFSRAGIFSGSLWWRSRDQEDPAYNDDQDRIMQQQIRNGTYRPGLKFFLQCGLMDEANDRNQNGVIDAVDDTRDLVTELVKKGYRLGDIAYLELEDGKHDVATWKKAMPAFLKWGWGSVNVK